MSQIFHSSDLARNDSFSNQIEVEPINPQNYPTPPYDEYSGSDHGELPFEVVAEEGGAEQIQEPQAPDNSFKKRPVKIVQEYIFCTMPSCENTYRDANELHYHLMGDHHVKPYKCQECDARFENHGELGPHVLNCHPNIQEDRWRCRISDCRSSFKSYHGLYQHRHNWHRMGKYNCGMEVCRINFTADQYYKVAKHQKSKSSRKFHQFYQCPECLEIRDSIIELTYHRRIHGGNNTAS